MFSKLNRMTLSRIMGEAHMTHVKPQQWLSESWASPVFTMDMDTLLPVTVIWEAYSPRTVNSHANCREKEAMF